MRVKVSLKESNDTFKVKFGETYELSDGGYEKGYAEGYEKGNTDGQEIGKAEGYEQGSADGYSKGSADGYESGKTDGYKQGVTDGYNEGYAEAKAEEEIFFTNHGTMYKKNMVIDTIGSDGFYAYAYRYADKMETLSVPYLESLWTATGYIFSGCTALKTASLPNIQRIGAMFFWGCTSLETVTLGTEENPMVAIAANAFQDCPALVNFNYIGIIDVNANFSASTKLSHDSLITILNSLSSSTTGTLTLGAVNLAKLTDTEKQIATNKGWKLA